MSNAKIPSVQQLLFKIYHAKRSIRNYKTKLAQYIMEQYKLSQEIQYTSFDTDGDNTVYPIDGIYETVDFLKQLLESLQLLNKENYNEQYTEDTFSIDFLRKNPYYTLWLIDKAWSYMFEFGLYQAGEIANTKAKYENGINYTFYQISSKIFSSHKDLNTIDTKNKLDSILMQRDMSKLEYNLDPILQGLKEDLFKIINFNVLTTTQATYTTQPQIKEVIKEVEKIVEVEKQVFIDIDPVQPDVDIREQLLLQLKQLEPTQFEKFALRLISSITQENEEETKNLVIHNGQVGDGGIDGRFQMKNKLGHYDNYVIQCKRYDTTSIGRPELQQFVGAMALYQTTQGVFITTSTFAKTAFDFINSVQHSYSIKTMDGQQLVDYMLEHKIGVKEKITQVMDREFFNQFEN